MTNNCHQLNSRLGAVYIILMIQLQCIVQHAEPLETANLFEIIIANSFANYGFRSRQCHLFHVLML